MTFVKKGDKEEVGVSDIVATLLVIVFAVDTVAFVDVVIVVVVAVDAVIVVAKYFSILLR